MGQYDFTYEFPTDFDKRIVQILQQKTAGAQLSAAFKACSYEYEKMGLAYYAGMRGDVWDKYALDFTIEGSKEHITLLKNRIRDVDDAISKALRPSISGFVVREILFLENEEDTPFPASDNDRLNADIATANVILTDLIRMMQGNTDITGVIIGTEVASIGAKAFADCTNLTYAVLECSPKTIATDCFEGSGIQAIFLHDTEEDAQSYLAFLVGIAHHTGAEIYYAHEWAYNDNGIPQAK